MVDLKIVERQKEGFTVTLVLLYLHAQPTYTVQSTEQPDTHFRHLRLDALGDQCFHSTLCRHRWFKVYKAITCNIIEHHVLTWILIEAGVLLKLYDEEKVD